MLTANFLLSFGFWLQMPILPFYLEQEFGLDKTTMGFVISCYTISALCMRAFSGYLMDSFSRKPLALIAFIIFSCVFGGYYLTASLLIFCVLRGLHGLSFGLSTVGLNTILIDVLPSSRRGEGIGYFGLANNLSMALGPLVGLYLGRTIISYNGVFLCGLTCGLIGCIVLACVKTKPKPKILNKQKISLDRFILIKGIPAAIALLLMSIPYGITTNYVILYAKESGFEVNSDLFFVLMACGMALARIFSGKLADKGYITQTISYGQIFVVICFLLLAFCKTFNNFSPILCAYTYLSCGCLMGIGFGIIFPSYNSLFVSLAPNNRRGTATSTYLTSWDVGLGIGIFIGGLISDKFGGFDASYIFGTITCIISAIFFKCYVTRHYLYNKLEK